MKTIHIVCTWNSNEREYVYFTEGYLPSLGEIRNAIPKKPKYLKPKSFPFSSEDKALAWVLSRRARGVLFRYGGGGSGGEAAVRKSLERKIETWILGYPLQEGACLENWFHDKPSDTNYRLIVHISEILKRSGSIAPWHGMYLSTVGKSRVLNLHWKRVAESNQYSTAKKFIEQLLDASSRGKDEVERVFANSGHPYWFSAGLEVD